MAIERVKNTDGSVSWKVRWREGGRGSRRRSKSFPTKREAQAYEDRIKAAKRGGDPALMYADQTLKELASDWFDNYASTTLQPRTLRDYAYLLDGQVIPRLGSLRLPEITVETVERFKADMTRAGVPRMTIRGSLIVLQGVLQRGVEWGRISRNPVKAIKKPTGKRQRAVRPLPPEHVEAVRAHLPQGDAALVATLAYAGLRPQEALALEWRHVQQRTLLIEQKNVNGQILAGQKVASRSVRSVDLAAPLRQDLVEWRLASGRSEGLVFPRKDGKPWTDTDWNNWTKRIWQEACVEAKLATVEVTETEVDGEKRKSRRYVGPRPYDLRHSFASLHVRAGMDIVALASQLGHDATMTLSTYAHVIAELKEAERKTVDEQILEARDPSVTPRKESHG